MTRIQYKKFLKPFARDLRQNMTDVEHLLWFKIRRRQILDVQFYRQKAIGNFIVDFFAPKVSLIIELDGSQHDEVENQQQDIYRDEYMRVLGLSVLRFSNREVAKSLAEVLQTIYDAIQVRKIPPPAFACASAGRPPFRKGGNDIKAASIEI